MSKNSQKWTFPVFPVKNPIISDCIILCPPKCGSFCFSGRANINQIFLFLLLILHNYQSRVVFIHHSIPLLSRLNIEMPSLVLIMLKSTSVSHPVPPILKATSRLCIMHHRGVHYLIWLDSRKFRAL